MALVNTEGNLSLAACNDKKNIHRRQDAPVCFDLTTIAYVARPEFVLSNAAMWDGVVTGVEIPNERAIDIDTPMDFAIARYLIEEWLPSEAGQL